MKKIEYQSGQIVVKAVKDDYDPYDKWYLFINERGEEKVHKKINHEPTSVELKLILEKYLKGDIFNESDSKRLSKK